MSCQTPFTSNTLLWTPFGATQTDIGLNRYDSSRFSFQAAIDLCVFLSRMYIEMCVFLRAEPSEKCGTIHERIPRTSV